MKVELTRFYCILVVVSKWRAITSCARTSSFQVGFTEEVVERECGYVMECICKAPHNESPWNYLRGVIDAAGGAERPEVRDFCENLYKDGCRVAYLLTFMVDSLAGRLEAEPELLGLALELCQTLAHKQDVIRCQYWNFMARGLEAQHGQRGIE